MAASGHLQWGCRAKAGGIAIAVKLCRRQGTVGRALEATSEKNLTRRQKICGWIAPWASHARGGGREGLQRWIINLRRINVATIVAAGNQYGAII